MPADFVSAIRGQLDETLADEQSSAKQLHAQLNNRLKQLGEQEERLTDLAADGSLSQAKIRARLASLHTGRLRLETGLTNTGEELALGVQILRNALHLLANPQQLYHQNSHSVRRHLHQTFYERFYLDNLEVTDDAKTPLFADITAARTAFARTKTDSTSADGTSKNTAQQENLRTAEASRTLTDSLTLADVLPVTVSSKAVLVGQLDRQHRPTGVQLTATPWNERLESGR
ncbi:hypothetical protein [Mycobacteroides abscessus]|uniref:hypothetical protein n=1 Tax=Mycobacteroides abscessus TaxID=36809 RepID=UPI0010427452|nr:hypothetical protein [Mycobacteroides abscessus]MDO3334170.1 hypothetical protein [Mycobacteroides abscessus subsp. bolletii]QSM87481.1 hypothetical protein I3U44_16710 [Mycobacteroides abscessus subsp. bolletii]